MMDAAKWALSEIERLTTENADLKSKLERESTEELTRKIPPIRRYEIDCWGNAIKQVEGGKWVRYDDHVAAVKLMRSEVERLKEQIASLNENLRDAKLEAKDFQNMLRGFKQ